MAKNLLQGIIKILLKYILPIVLLFVLFKINIYAGISGLIVLIAYSAYKYIPSYYAIKGSSAYSEGKLQEAAAWFKKSYETGRAKDNLVISYCYLLLKTGQFDLAYDILSKLLRKPLPFEQKMNAKSNLALAIWKKGSLNEAIQLLGEVHSQYENTNVYGSLGFMLILSGDLQKALDYNLKAYEYNDTNPVILDNLAHTYYLLGQYEESLEVFEKLMALSPAPSFAEAYYDYGLLLEKLGRQEEAVKMYEKADTFNLTSLSAITKEDIQNKLHGNTSGG